VEYDTNKYDIVAKFKLYYQINDVNCSLGERLVSLKKYLIVIIFIIFILTALYHYIYGNKFV
jgi:hypothetical protein